MTEWVASVGCVHREVAVARWASAMPSSSHRSCRRARGDAGVPTVQTREKGQTAWTEVPADGQDAEEPGSPAPAFEITQAAEGEGEPPIVLGVGAEPDDDSAPGRPLAS